MPQEAPPPLAGNLPALRALQVIKKAGHNSNTISARLGPKAIEIQSGNKLVDSAISVLNGFGYTAQDVSPLLDPVRPPMSAEEARWRR